MHYNRYQDLVGEGVNTHPTAPPVRDFDLHCPQMAVKGCNYYAASCLARMKDEKGPCNPHKCETGRQVWLDTGEALPAEKIKKDHPAHCVYCGLVLDQRRQRSFCYRVACVAKYEAEKAANV